ncbi:MAG: ABC transporter permease [Bacteriovoracaceae bacterium]
MRYLKLYSHFVRFSFSKAFQFRLDFFFRIFMDVIFYIVNILFFKVIFLHSTLIGGWNEPQVTVFICGYLLMDSIYMTIFSNNLWWFPFYINKGDLDYYLIRPVSSLFFLTMRDFAANSFMNLLLAIALFVWSLFSYPGLIVPWKLILYILLIVNGAILYSIFYLFAVIPVFWTKSPRGLAELYWKASHLGERPDHIYKGLFKRILTTIFPMAIIASYPARIFLNDFDPWILFNIILVTIFSGVTLVFLWRKALKSYTSASS